MKRDIAQAREAQRQKTSRRIAEQALQEPWFGLAKRSKPVRTVLVNNRLHKPPPLTATQSRPRWQPRIARNPKHALDKVKGRLSQGRMRWINRNGCKLNSLPTPSGAHGWPRKDMTFHVSARTDECVEMRLPVTHHATPRHQQSTRHGTR